MKDDPETTSTAETAAATDSNTEHTGGARTAATAALEAKISALNFGIEKSLRYHQRRRGHYEHIHRCVMLGVILCGSAAFANQIPQVAGFVAALLGAFDLVYGFSHKSRDHQLLHKRFSDLAIEVRTTKAPIDADYNGWQRKRLRIEADEPPIFWAVEKDCHNEVAVAWGRPNAVDPLTQKQRRLMNWCRFESVAERN